MSIYFNSHQIIIKRERNTSGLKYVLSATFTAYDADIQPVEGSRLNEVGGRIGKTYEAFIDATNPIKEGDHIQIIESGKRYAVKAVSTWESAGLLDHKHLIIEAQD